MCVFVAGWGGHLASHLYLSLLFALSLCSDIFPNNIVLSTGTIKLIDLGDSCVRAHALNGLQWGDGSIDSATLGHAGTASRGRQSPVTTFRDLAVSPPAAFTASAVCIAVETKHGICEDSFIGGKLCVMCVGVGGRM